MMPTYNTSDTNQTGTDETGTEPAAGVAVVASIGALRVEIGEPVEVGETVGFGRGEQRDPFCDHEFADGGLCGHDALPGGVRCLVHRDDGQPDYAIGGGR